MGVQCDGQALTARTGDALRLLPGAERQITAVSEARAVVASGAAPPVTAQGATRPLPWAA